MSRQMLVILTLLAAIATGAYHFSRKQSFDPAQLCDFASELGRDERWSGKVAPAFEIRLVDETTFTVADVVGKKVVVLNFFATWCEPCREEMPEINRYYAEHVSRGLILVGIDADEAAEKVKAFVSKMRLGFPVGIDDDETIGKKYGITVFPTTLVIGLDGRIALRIEGAVMNADAALQPTVMPLLDILAKGNGVSKKEYQRQAEAEDYRDVLPWSLRKGGGQSIELTGRSRSIAEKMMCPCGRDRTVLTCTCDTSQDLRRRLARGDFEGKSDQQVIDSLEQGITEGEASQ